MKASRLIKVLLIKIYLFWKNEARAEEILEPRNGNNEGAIYIGTTIAALAVVCLILAIGLRITDN